MWPPRQTSSSPRDPEIIFRTDPDNPSRLLSSEDGSPPKKSRIGVYDTTILCEQCEVITSPIDDQARKDLKEDFAGYSPILYEGTTVGYSTEQIDQGNLKRFAMSVLWRSAASTHEFYKLVPKRIATSELWDLIQSPGSITPECLSTLVWAYPEDSFGEVTPNPFIETLNGVRFARIYMGRYNLSIKIDSKTTPSPFRELTVGSSQQTVIVLRPGPSRHELAVLADVARRNKEAIERVIASRANR